MKKPEKHEVAIGRIATDESLQARTRLDEDTIARYEATLRQAMEDGTGWPFPPLVCVFDLLVDGFHRLEAAKRVGWDTVPVIVHDGSREDAIRLAVGANANHGLPRSREDVRRAIILAAETWPDMSARAIGRLVGCSPQTVLNVIERASEVSKLDTPSDGPIDGSQAVQPEVEQMPSSEPASTAPVTKRVTSAREDARIHAKKAMAAIEAAMRHAGDHKEIYKPSDFADFTKEIDRLWERARAWSRDRGSPAANPEVTASKEPAPAMGYTLI